MHLMLNIRKVIQWSPICDGALYICVYKDNKKILKQTASLLQFSILQLKSCVLEHPSAYKHTLLFPGRSKLKPLGPARDINYVHVFWCRICNFPSSEEIRGNINPSQGRETLF